MRKYFIFKTRHSHNPSNELPMHHEHLTAHEFARFVFVMTFIGAAMFMIAAGWVAWG